MKSSRSRRYPTSERTRIAALEQQIGLLSTQLYALRTATPPKSDARMRALLMVCASLMVTNELDMVLQLVVREAAQLFHGASGALLFLVDPVAGVPVLRASSHGPVPRLVPTAAHNIAGRAFIAPRAMLLVGPQLELALEEFSEEQQQLLNELVGDWPPSSVLLAPLRSVDQRLGALICFGSVNAHFFHPRDLPVIQALADLAAVSIRETMQRARTTALQRDLDRTQSLQAETQLQLSTAQAQLLQSAKLAAIGELAASVAHEINNPLYAARNSLYLVSQDMPLDSPQRPFLEIAQSELSRIARIITRMRDFYRPSRSDLEPTDCNALLVETLEFVQTHLRHGHVAVVSELDPRLPVIVAEADQMRQVFLNLMLNACDAMQAGGTLRVTTQYQARASDQLPELAISIADTGVGIAPEHQLHLFEPFYTTKPNGTGLGLTITAHIIAQHGGQIAVDSTPGIGTTFVITLPASTSG